MIRMFRLLGVTLFFIAPLAHSATLTITLKNGRTVTYQMDEVQSVVYSDSGRGSTSSTASSSGASAATVNWTGSWRTTDVSIGRIALTQTGSDLSGTYHGGSSRISGSISGNVFTGQWTEGRSRRGGSMTLTMQADGRTLKGSWSFASSPDSKASFTATRE